MSTDFGNKAIKPPYNHKMNNSGTKFTHVLLLVRFYKSNTFLDYT